MCDESSGTPIVTQPSFLVRRVTIQAARVTVSRGTSRPTGESLGVLRDDF
ncbi:MAG TPA: hypothetical protein VF981_02385 [Gemmatimonadaceae bacterium]